MPFGSSPSALELTGPLHRPPSALVGRTSCSPWSSHGLQVMPLPAGPPAEGLPLGASEQLSRGLFDHTKAGTNVPLQSTMRSKWLSRVSQKPKGTR